MLESGAMVAFLADAFPEKELAPAPGITAARADYLQVMNFGSSWMDMMLWQIRIHEHVLPASEKDELTIARYRSKFEKEAEPQLEKRLERSTYVCGEAFTAADCVIGHNVFWGMGYGLCRGPVFRRYIGTLSSRPAFLKAFSDMANFTVQPPENNALAGKFTG
jgi:glutathione S-transferase